MFFDRKIEGWKKVKKQLLKDDNFETGYKKIFEYVNCKDTSVRMVVVKNYMWVIVRFYKCINGKFVRNDFNFLPGEIKVFTSNTMFSIFKNNCLSRAVRYKNNEVNSDTEFSIYIFNEHAPHIGLFSTLSGLKDMTNDDIQFRRSVTLADVLDKLDEVNNNIKKQLIVLNKILRLNESNLNKLFEAISIKDVNYNFKEVK